MKKHQLYALPAALAMMQASPLILAQAAAELDITITVLEEGQTPAGFIQQLELPPADFFATGAFEATTGIDADGSEAATAAAELNAEVADLTGAATETLNNAVRETISIDGTAALSTETATLVPNTIVDVLDTELPLVDSLETVLDAGLDDVTDNLPPLDDVTGGVGNVIDNVTGGTGGAGVLPDLPGIVDNLDDSLDTIAPGVDNLGETLPDLGTGVLNTDAVLQGAADTRTALPLVDAVGGVENLVNDVAGDTVDELDTASPELPATDLLETLPDDLSDLLP